MVKQRVVDVFLQNHSTITTGVGVSKASDLRELGLDLDASSTVRVLTRLDDPDVLAMLLLLAFARFILIVCFESCILGVRCARLDVECQR